MGGFAMCAQLDEDEDGEPVSQQRDVLIEEGLLETLASVCIKLTDQIKTKKSHVLEKQFLSLCKTCLCTFETDPSLESDPNDSSHGNDHRSPLCFLPSIFVVTPCLKPPYFAPCSKSPPTARL